LEVPRFRARSGGECRPKHQFASSVHGSSPLARGVRDHVRIITLTLGIIPAHGCVPRKPDGGPTTDSGVLIGSCKPSRNASISSSTSTTTPDWTRPRTRSRVASTQDYGPTGPSFMLLTYEGPASGWAFTRRSPDGDPWSILVPKQGGTLLRIGLLNLNHDASPCQLLARGISEYQGARRCADVSKGRGELTRLVPRVTSECRTGVLVRGSGQCHKYDEFRHFDEKCQCRATCFGV
jgi:hypothetical protein